MGKEKKFKKADLRRSLSLDGASIAADKRTIELAFSSDVPLERWPGMVEKLSHAPGACDLTRLNDGAPLLFNHDLDEVIGVVENARVDADGRGRAVVRFSRSEEAETVWQDVQDGILRNVSVGYRVKDVMLREQADGLDTYEVTKWEPFEISIVSVPADISVGVGRGLMNPEDDEEESCLEERAPQEVAPPQAPKVDGEEGEDAVDEASETPEEQAAELADMVLKGMQKKSIQTQPTTQVSIMSTPNNTPADGVGAERARSEAILTAGEKYNEQALASEFVRSGKSVDEFRSALLEQVEKRNKSTVKESAAIGLSDKEARDFKIVNVLRALSAAPEEAARAREAAAFELEACRAAADKAGREVRGTMIPWDVLSRSTNVISKDTGTGLTGTGKNTVATTLLSGSFIDVLRNKSVLLQNATVLAGLVGNVDIPKQTSRPAVSWLGEDASAATTDIDFGLVSLRTHTLAAKSEITRRMLMQSSIGVEALVRENLAREIALGMDLAGYYGDGSANSPVGIKSTSGIGSATFAGANPTFAELVAMETTVSLANADVASMAYIANAAFRGYAKTALKFPTTAASGTIWEPGNTVNGYNALTTNQVATGDVFFGNFADLLVGMWGGLEITVDPYTYSDKGRIRVVTMQDCDFQVRRTQSFVVGAPAA